MKKLFNRVLCFFGYHRKMIWGDAVYYCKHCDKENFK